MFFPFNAGKFVNFTCKNEYDNKVSLYDNIIALDR